MRELNLLQDLPPTPERIVGTRNIHHRIAASYRGREFFDGDRNCGYGGLKYDGRWEPVAKRIVAEYGLDTGGCRVMQVNCEKGFLLYELHKLGVMVSGVDSSSYARRYSVEEIRQQISPKWPIGTYDLLIWLGIYSNTLADTMMHLRQIEMTAFNAFITLASYETEEDLRLLRQWMLLGTTVLRKDEWLEVLKHTGYTGDYWFVNAQSLRLREA